MFALIYLLLDTVLSNYDVVWFNVYMVQQSVVARPAKTQHVNRFTAIRYVCISLLFDAVLTYYDVVWLDVYMVQYSALARQSKNHV